MVIRKLGGEKSKQGRRFCLFGPLEDVLAKNPWPKCAFSGFFAFFFVQCGVEFVLQGVAPRPRPEEVTLICPYMHGHGGHPEEKDPAK